MYNAPAVALTLPERLEPGDLLGVAAPSSPIRPELLKKGVRELESLGFRVRVDDSAFARHRYLAGDDDRRAGEINAMLADPEVRAVLCARGGYGWPRIVDRIDWDALRRDPKPMVGFSDATVALTAAVQEAAVMAVHGPMVAVDIRKGEPGYDRVNFIRLLTRPEPLGRLVPPGLEALRPGTGEGPLAGGCLTLLTRAAGTPWQARTAGSILFLEDWQTKPFQLDHMLQQLRQAGMLDGVRGVVFGRMLECRQTDEDDYSIQDVILDCLEPVLPAGVPVLCGFPSGHVDVPNVALPMGVAARVDAGDASLEILEPAVC